MRTIILTFLCFNSILYAQDWQTIQKADTYQSTPYQQFIINPYTNDFWFVNFLKTVKINTSGAVSIYTDAQLGVLVAGSPIKFTFTPTKVFHAKYYYGLYEFDGSNSQFVYNYYTFSDITSSGDTVFVTHNSEPYLKFINGINLNSNFSASKVFSKNSFLYHSFGVQSSLIYYIGPSQNDFVFFSQTDPEYFCPQFHDIKYSRHTDTLYVACKKGISFAYNYDFLDTITPNNTTNMPSANVLEMEFDHLDRLWAIFGDENDKPFSLAMLENGVWSNYYDAFNSPIYFNANFDVNYFIEMEIDTLGNVWVCDKNNLHVLSSATTPAWVGLQEKSFNNKISVYPNPSSENITINFGSLTGNKTVKICDFKGQLIQEFETNESNYYLSLKNYAKGMYVLKCINEQTLYHLKIGKD